MFGEKNHQVVFVDPQVDFCQDGELALTGCVEEMERLVALAAKFQAPRPSLDAQLEWPLHCVIGTRQ